LAIQRVVVSRLPDPKNIGIKTLINVIKIITFARPKHVSPLDTGQLPTGKSNTPSSMT